MALYNNRKQEELFHLHDPKKSTSTDCDPIKGAFSNFICEKSYILAQPTGEFNCIWWAIGVKEFIDPAKYINKYYDQRLEVAKLIHSTDHSLSIPLYSYEKNTSVCKRAIKSFFEEYKENSVLPKKDKYVAVDKISTLLQDDTIAFYFKAGEDQFEENGIARKGFQHAARYVEDVNSWVSDIWTSKLGHYKLMTHGEHELDGEIYGHILCYLVPEENIKTELWKIRRFYHDQYRQM